MQTTKVLNFKDLKVAVDNQLQLMTVGTLFRTGVDKDKLWDTYIDSFPEGTNPIFRERTEYDCQCCRQFIRACGDAVAIVDGKLVSIWDVEVGGQFQPVVDALSALVKSEHITDVFIHYEKNLGTDNSVQLLEDKSTLRWDHFYFNLPHRLVKKKDAIGTRLSTLRSNKEVFKRSLEEITLESVETVLELIEQGSLYRGSEHKAIIKLFKDHKKVYDKLDISDCEGKKDNYCWTNSIAIGAGAKIRNTVIGTLLSDISDGMPLDKAVKGFEAKVAPANYKRPTALVTKGMIDKAEKQVVELGIGDSLQRRYAVEEDITVNNVLFADRKITKLKGSIFDDLKADVKDKKPNLKKVDDVDIKTFIEDILPKAESVELFLENTHENNLMSLVAPINKDSKNIFKWDNNFSWSYNGEFTDSIKERVKKAGGSVTGDLRCSLSWFNYDDLDIHMQEPRKSGNSHHHIYYGNRGINSNSGGKLDVDMNAGGKTSRSAVENITYARRRTLIEGEEYHLYVNQFCKRESKDVGFDCEIEFDGVIHSYHYDKAVSGNVTVAKFKYTKEKGIEFISSLPSTKAVKDVWNLATQKFHKVSMIMNSPNHWDNHVTGNKHWFFILDKCRNDAKTRGFYNEFLNNELTEHRKVFEILGSRMKTEVSDKQLSGIGFSSTQKNSILCRVSGSFARTIKINF
jgi:hypothetical protein